MYHQIDLMKDGVKVGDFRWRAEDGGLTPYEAIEQIRERYPGAEAVYQGRFPAELTPIKVAS